MGLNFKLVEKDYDKTTDDLLYKSIKNDYMDGLRRDELCEKYDIGKSYYQKHIVPRLKEDNVMVRRNGNRKSFLRTNHPNKTGVYRLRIIGEGVDRFYRYVIQHKGESKSFTSNDINVLRDRVIDNGYEWVVYDKEKARGYGLEC